MRIDRLRPTPLQSRSAALLLALVALAIAYLLFLHWWFVAPLLRVNAEIREQRQVHAKYAAAIAQQPLLEQRLARLGTGAAAGSFLAGSDASAAVADLIQRATDVVAAHAHEGSGCSMPQKMPVESDDTSGPYRRVTVQITLVCGIQPLSAVLHDFDRGLPYLFVDQIMLTRSPAAHGRLEAQLTLSAYLHPDAAPRTPPTSAR